MELGKRSPSARDPILERYLLLRRWARKSGARRTVKIAREGIPSVWETQVEKGRLS